MDQEASPGQSVLQSILHEMVSQLRERELEPAVLDAMVSWAEGSDLSEEGLLEALRGGAEADNETG